jgi:hypothetical protein
MLTALLSQTAPKVYAMKRADGELLELGEQLARLQPELARMLHWVDEGPGNVRCRSALRECVERETENWRRLCPGNGCPRGALPGLIQSAAG